MKGNGAFQLEIRENKDATFAHAVSSYVLLPGLAHHDLRNLTFSCCLFDKALFQMRVKSTPKPQIPTKAHTSFRFVGVD